MTFHEENPPNRFGSTSELTGKIPKSAQAKCSLCGKMFDRSQSKTMPFCSNRCQQIDLGNWLNESYGLPVETDEPREEDLG